MGYRCPGCGKDFGFDKEAFNNHLNFECGEGAAYVFASLAHVESICGNVKQIPAHITEEIIPKMQSLPQSAKDIIMSRENKALDYTSQMLIINPDGRADSWVPSVSDVFAEDWEIVI